MPQSIQWKITLLFIAVITVCIGMMGLYLVNFVRDNQTNNLRTSLANEARITAVTSQPFSLLQPSHWTHWRNNWEPMLLPA